MANLALRCSGKPENGTTRRQLGSSSSQPGPSMGRWTVSAASCYCLWIRRLPVPVRKRIRYLLPRFLPYFFFKKRFWSPHSRGVRRSAGWRISASIRGTRQSSAGFGFSDWRKNQGWTRPIQQRIQVQRMRLKAIEKRQDNLMRQVE